MLYRRDLTAVLDGKEADLAAANTEARYLLHMCTELQKQAGQQQATKDALFKARADRYLICVSAPDL